MLCNVVVHKLSEKEICEITSGSKDDNDDKPLRSGFYNSRKRKLNCTTDGNEVPDSIVDNKNVSYDNKKSPLFTAGARIDPNAIDIVQVTDNTEKAAGWSGCCHNPSLSSDINANYHKRCLDVAFAENRRLRSTNKDLMTELKNVKALLEIYQKNCKLLEREKVEIKASNRERIRKISRYCNELFSIVINTNENNKDIKSLLLNQDQITSSCIETFQPLNRLLFQFSTNTSNSSFSQE